MSEPTHNAGEKCRICLGYEEFCPHCHDTGLKPAVESPAADVKERDIVKLACLMFECETLPLTFDRLDIYHALIWHKSEMAKLEADLTTKLGALKDENERLVKFHAEDMRVTNESATFHMKRCRELEQANARANQLIGSQAEENDKIVNTLRAENQGLQDKLKEALLPTLEHVQDVYALSKLRGENQGLEAIIKSKQTSITDLASHVRYQAKEVEKLRDSIKVVTDYHTYQDWARLPEPVSEALHKLQEALKPTPEESGSKPK